MVDRPADEFAATRVGVAQGDVVWNPSALIGWLAYGERLGVADGAGALLICVALVLIRLPDGKAAKPATV